MALYGTAEANQGILAIMPNELWFVGPTEQRDFKLVEF